MKPNNIVLLDKKDTPKGGNVKPTPIKPIERPENKPQPTPKPTPGGDNNTKPVTLPTPAPNPGGNVTPPTPNSDQPQPVDPPTPKPQPEKPKTPEELMKPDESLRIKDFAPFPEPEFPEYKYIPEKIDPTLPQGVFDNPTNDTNNHTLKENIDGLHAKLDAYGHKYYTKEYF